MSVGQVFDRIQADVLALPGVTAKDKATALADSYYASLGLQQAKFMLTSLRTSVINTPDADLLQIAFWVRTIVGAACASILEDAQIESRYLAQFGP